jgi:membrane protein CcdC involved in cytochrome C biogenesis
MMILIVLFLERLVVVLRMLSSEYATKTLFWAHLLIPFFAMGTDFFIFVSNTLFLLKQSRKGVVEFIKHMYNQMR